MQPPQPPAQPAELDSRAAALLAWFAMERRTASMSVADATAHLADLEQPESADALFYYALLNQRAASYGRLIQARDTLAQLQDDTSLLEEQRQLARVLRRYNQNRINSYLGSRKSMETISALERQLQQAQEQRVILEQKIQALTDLETDISTRKEESPGAGSITPR